MEKIGVEWYITSTIYRCQEVVSTYYTKLSVALVYAWNKLGYFKCVKNATYIIIRTGKHLFVAFPIQNSL